MKILVVGGGGREHAIIKQLKKNKNAEEIYALPGNGGIGKDAKCVNISAKDIEGIVNFAERVGIDYAVVAPDDPLALGAVDALNEKGIPCFGPCKAAAEIESSKVFAKNLMKKYGIPTASYEVFSDMDTALAFLEKSRFPAVIKADGLALGKGVTIAKDLKEAKSAVRALMQDKVFGESGSRVVIEEFLTGPEVSVLAFTDGTAVKPMVSSMDHKRAGDGDTGPNTGGMGTVAPNPYYTKEVAKRCMEEIFIPTVRAMNKENRKFKGCLYFGLMLTEDGPKVIEYNCRFGDPETQVVLPLIKSDLLEIMLAVTDERLSETPVEFKGGSACCVVLASEGYPGKYKTGFPVSVEEDCKGEIFYAGVKEDGGKLITSGGRVLGVTAVADTLSGAVKKAYAAADKIHFENRYMRRDIGAAALAAKEKN